MESDVEDFRKTAIASSEHLGHSSWFSQRKVGQV